tara:strand:+ start:1599 stop:2201 length:603 start_codon:yes stop_codon:yes gene_type:complete
MPHDEDDNNLNILVDNFIDNILNKLTNSSINNNKTNSNKTDSSKTNSNKTNSNKTDSNKIDKYNIDNISSKIIDLLSKYNLNNTSTSYFSKKIPNQPEEKYYGNREYKRFLIFNDKHENNNIKLNKRSTQLLFRLNEGDGKALYIIGLEDNGIVYGIQENILIKSIENIIKMTKIINVNIKNINIYNGINGYISSIRIFI